MIIGRAKSEIELRSQIIRAEFSRLDSDNLRVRLFDKQSGICLVCTKPMQSEDSVVAQIDHANSVWGWAESPSPIEEAVFHANKESNLILAHIRCNSVKNSEDLEEFLEQVTSGEISLDAPKILTSEEIETLKSNDFKRRSAAAKKRIETIGPEGFSVASNKRIETMSPEGFSASSKKRAETMGFEGFSAAAKKAVETMGTEGLAARAKKRAETMGPERVQALGRICGRIAVESGQLASIRTPENQAKGGRAAVKSGQLASVRTPESSAKGGHIGGKISGRKNKENGVGIFAEGYDKGKGGRISGRIAAESGQLASVRTPESCAKGSRTATHNRWHVNRGIVSPSCTLCTPTDSI